MYSAHFPAMFCSLFLLTISSLATSSALQYPLGISTESQAFLKKPLVSSGAIQDDINGDALLDRAKHLFSLAELSLDEYNHPTRVIGSPGSQR